MYQLLANEINKLIPYYLVEELKQTQNLNLSLFSNVLLPPKCFGFGWTFNFAVLGRMSKSVVPNRNQERWKTSFSCVFRGTYSSHKLAATYNALILQSRLVLFVCVTSSLIVEVVFLGLKYDIPETSDRRDDHQQDAEYDANPVNKPR